MVHALRECHRVLKPNGILIDLRPMAVHRRVGIARGDDWNYVAAMSEPFDDDRAANRAVAQVMREGLFWREQETTFELARHIATLDDFRMWLDEFTKLGGFVEKPSLFKRVAREFTAESEKGGAEIVVWGPLRLAVLRKD